MELDLNKKRDTRGIENPLSAIFDLADDVSIHSRYVRKMVWYAIIFMIFWMFFNFILILDSLARGRVIPFTLLLGLMISGLVAIWLILRTHVFFKYFTRRYNGIRTVRDSDTPAKIPKGASMEERYLNFLKSKHPPLQELLKRNPKALLWRTKLKGRTGTHHEFDMYISQNPKTSWKIFSFGEPGYGLFVRKIKGKPKLDHILEVKKSVSDISDACEIIPSRIVLLYKFPEHFNGLSEDLYSFLVKEEFNLNIKGKNYYPVIQVVGETSDGFYDFTPLVPEFADRLP